MDGTSQGNRGDVNDRPQGHAVDNSYSNTQCQTTAQGATVLRAGYFSNIQGTCKKTCEMNQIGNFHSLAVDDAATAIPINNLATHTTQMFQANAKNR